MWSRSVQIVRATITVTVAGEVSVVNAKKEGLIFAITRAIGCQKNTPKFFPAGAAVKSGYLSSV